MKIWWRLLLIVPIALLPAREGAGEQVASGTWALETALRDGAYTLASRDTDGQFLICFTSGTVRSVTVAAGVEESQLARGSCTVFAPTEEAGIVVNFSAAQGADATHAVALGTFSVILPSVD